jgi:hypothetical protein
LHEISKTNALHATDDKIPTSKKHRWEACGIISSPGLLLTCW